MGHDPPVGALRVVGRTIVLRDASGVEHHVLVSAGGTVAVGDTTTSAGGTVAVGDTPISAGGTVAVGDTPIDVCEMADGSLHLRGPQQALAWAVISEGTAWVFLEGRVFTFEVGPVARRRTTAAHHGPITAPMPATVRKIAVSVGDAVARGDVLIVLEAMKMEMPVRADADGTVQSVNCREGERVKPGQVLVELE
jgi:geranyl-CoA carboxylase alpha subunit